MPKLIISNIFLFIGFSAETRITPTQEPTVHPFDIFGINNSSLKIDDDEHYNLTTDSSSPGSSTVDQHLSTTIQKNETDEPQVVGVIGVTRKKYQMMPLAVGGITLLAGLVTLFTVVGLFMYCNKRNPGFEYQPAGSVDIEQHI